jgi:hypothetical protein
VAGTASLAPPAFAIGLLLVASPCPCAAGARRVARESLARKANAPVSAGTTAERRVAANRT